jgi:hypothetical protein
LTPSTRAYPSKKSGTGCRHKLSPNVPNKKHNTAYTSGRVRNGILEKRREAIRSCSAAHNAAMQGPIAAAEAFQCPGILVPIRNTDLFQGCLANGLRIVHPMTLMSTGLYNESVGAFLPSVLF